MKNIFELGKKLRENYHKEYERSIEKKEEFFSEQAKSILSFSKGFTKTMQVEESPVRITWFEDGEINACYNAVDRHAEATPQKTALIYENDAGETSSLTYAELQTETVRYANYLIQKGVKKGDTVCVYMPMEPSSLVVCLACARIGAAHTVVFGGFSSDSLSLRIDDSDAVWLFTIDAVHRGGKEISYLENVNSTLDALLESGNTSLKGVFVQNRDPELRKTEVLSQIAGKTTVDLKSEIDFARADMNTPVECVPVPSEHILFHLYTSGSTGKPKGVSHSTAGYLLYAALTTLVCFDIREEDVFFCTAELGWITGHTYVMYGPLALGITTVVYGSTPVYPDAYRLFKSIEKHGATHFYTAPTVVRLLQKSLPTSLVRPKDINESTDDLTPAVDHVPDSPASMRSIFTRGITGVFNRENYAKELPEDSPLHRIDLSSLRVLGSVGEPINKSAYIWLSMFFGDGKLPVVDTYWQTEAGGVMLSPMIGVSDPKPECASFPFFGMQPVVSKKEAEGVEEEESGRNGILFFRGFWPGIARTIVKNHDRYEKAYFPHAGHFYTGDEVCRDTEGYFWIRGRVDDVINVSGHRLSTAEIESAVCSVKEIAEAAALGKEDEVTGQSICIFVVKRTPIEDEVLFPLVKQALRKKIGAVISPKTIISCTELPKTSTGKMMRRVLRKLMEGQEIGDISTCVNPDCIRQLCEVLVKSPSGSVQ
ncbi:acetyl-CoA synthetase [Nematocida sp. AWRm77]|nr:acetyl-CoA synthetase [Nematocida sp. AWRm77]